MSIQHIVILGAGPCGLSTAIALSKISALTPDPPPLRVTLIETRPALQTIGGTINMTPLAMQYLEHLGAGQQLKDNSIELISGIDAISLPLGWRLGNLWGGVGARRTARYELVRSLHDTIKREHSESIHMSWGKRVIEISEAQDRVQLKFSDQSTIECDVLLGCDGVNSAARTLYVEPTRKKEYSGRGVAMGWAAGAANQSKDPGSSPITFPDGQPALRDTAAFSATGGTLIASYYEPTRQDIFFAHVRKMAEHEAVDRDGWHLAGEDQEAVRREVIETYSHSRIKGLEAVIAKCDSWQIYPIYQLPPQGRWHKGRVLLLGDAAHAVSNPPPGKVLPIQSLRHQLVDATSRRKHRYRNRRWGAHRTDPQSTHNKTCRAASLRLRIRTQSRH
jgi:2-polyprenyl-6-methoxyphenol hydroxylase-like FAD-dependent oxidoreductase